MNPEKEIGGDDELFSVEQLREAAVPVNCVCGIYVLFDGDEVVYVGQSRNVHGRIGNHVVEGVKKFDRFAVVEVEADLLDYLESKYILALQPKYNGGKLPMQVTAVLAGITTREELNSPSSLERLTAAVESLNGVLGPVSDEPRS